MSASNLAAVVLTYNEELNLPACLASLRGLTPNVVVVDSGSTDRSLEIAAQHDATILSHPFTRHVDQWRWALAHLDSSIEWVLGLDADQRLSPELRCELARLFGPDQQRLLESDGFYITRRQVFRGKWIQHGGYYPKRLLKLFRLSAVRLDDRDLMDHHFYVHGRLQILRHDLIEDNLKEADLAFWLQKHIGYAELHAREELLRRSDGAHWAIKPSLLGSPDQRVVWCKQMWYRMPLYARPFLYFVYRYFLRGGILDGKQGFVFHFLQGFWYRLLVDIRLDELIESKSH